MGKDIIPEKIPEDFRYDDSYYEAIGLLKEDCISETMYISAAI